MGLYKSVLSRNDANGEEPPPPHLPSSRSTNLAFPSDYVALEPLLEEPMWETSALRWLHRHYPRVPLRNFPPWTMRPGYRPVPFIPHSTGQ